LAGIAMFVSSNTLDTVVIINLLFGAIVSIAEIAVAWGLWHLRLWAFWAVVIVEAIRVVHGLYTWFVVHTPGTSPLSLIIAILILLYLLIDRKVRAAFRV